MKILNLYAGIGGNRKLWGNEHEVTAIEYDKDIAAAYKKHFPNDNVIVTDAHQYLLDHYKEFDFIWSSPPCQTHSSFRQNICVRFRGTAAAYPDMKLYQEIIFLKYNSICPFVVENVKPYYEPFIKGKLIQRHLFWSNFDIEDFNIPSEKLRSAQIPDLQKLHGFDLSDSNIKEKRQVLRNCVDAKLGKHILDCANKHKDVKD